MIIKSLPFSVTPEPIPPTALTADSETFMRGVELMDRTAWLGHIEDVTNITFAEKDTPDAITSNEPLALTEFQTNPFSEEHTAEGLKLRVKGTIIFPTTLTVAEILAEHNVLILNGNISNALFGGFLIFTLGDLLSESDIKISDSNISDGFLTLSLNILSGVIA